MRYRKLKRWKYQLVQSTELKLGFTPPDNIDTEYIILRVDRRLLLSKGYAWDGASGPCPDTRNIMKASLVHDALYQLMRIGRLHPAYRQFADEELRRLCIQAGMSKFWANVVYWGVRVFCARGIRQLSEEHIIGIP
jgi:hypothetical protein